MKTSKPLLLILPLLSTSISAAPLADSMFDLMDSDKNGDISMQEFNTAGIDSEGTEWSQGLSKVCTEKVLKIATPDLVETYKLLDKNGDDKITREELSKQEHRCMMIIGKLHLRPLTVTKINLFQKMSI